LGALVAVIVATSGAQAGPKEEARERYDRAMELVKEQDYQSALIEFQRAYELEPNFQVLFNIGQAHVALGRPIEAIDALTRFLSDGGAAVSSEQRKRTLDEIERQRAFVGEIILTVAPPGALVTVDGREIGKSPLPGPVRVGIGSHRVSVTAEGYVPFEKSLTVAGKDRKELAVQLAAVPAGGANAPSTVVPPNESPDALREAPRRSPVLAYVVGGTGLAFAGVGAAFGVMALGKDKDIERLCLSGVNCSGEALDAERDRNRDAWIANVGVGLGIVGIGAATVMLLSAGNETTHGKDKALSFDVRVEAAKQQQGIWVTGMF